MDKEDLSLGESEGGERRRRGRGGREYQRLREIERQSERETERGKGGRLLSILGS